MMINLIKQNSNKKNPQKYLNWMIKIHNQIKIKI